MDISITIIGAGVVGLAIAAEISKHRNNVFVIEKNRKFGQETSSRNSEVVHSGIYYPNGSLKAKLCVEGKKLLYDYCREKEISHKICGKLIVATNDFEKAQLEEILANAINNGVTDAKILIEDEIYELEPEIKAISAIHFPSTGIIDSYGLMKQLESDAINNGVQFVYGSEVVGIKKLKSGYGVDLLDEKGENYNFSTEIIINSAGLFSDRIPKMLGINENSYELSFWKGCYFSVSNGKHKKINRLIYPVPETNTISLGIHATLDLGGRMKLGPDVVYLPEKIIDYSIDVKLANKFFDSAFRFLPFLEKQDLFPDQCGIRPKLQKPGEATRDFVIAEETEKGFPCLINLIGIESPGLTSCIAIGKYVLKML